MNTVISNPFRDKSLNGANGLNCVFCKIAKKEIAAEILYEDSDISAFKDAHPLAPVHILIIPKRHIESVNNWTRSDVQLAGKMIIVAKEIAEKAGIKDSGYKLLFRVGRDGGQEVGHIHLHLLGGARLVEDIHPVK
ncbi:histidine triad nucleotide-binding protein [Patescibacteria group bacterium]|nr:histidine triad nucleotide-binding protein [Patescibacteria group bacterium]MBU3999732.1 histidine triad nucleotide-binding protein [Patescibacteria group bacterium]MBU4057111.1 histidine triad nucleotide-binding protein [Patescibacteria group bacterium]MBU4369021.1 histidine triad nucleotide-binding protein [Patescibacteria group bacterium]